MVSRIGYSHLPGNSDKHWVQGSKAVFSSSNKSSSEIGNGLSSCMFGGCCSTFKVIAFMVEALMGAARPGGGLTTVIVALFVDVLSCLCSGLRLH